MDIYTKKGDEGTTDLLTGFRVAKSDSTIEALGRIDQLTTAIGELRNEVHGTELAQELNDIQKDLIIYMSNVAKHFEYAVCDTKAKELETYIDRNSLMYPPIKVFVTPGDSKAGILADQARVAARQSERALVKMVDEYQLSRQPLAYINRLSDYFYSVARMLDFKDKIQKVLSNETNNPSLQKRVLNLKQAKKHAEYARNMATKMGLSVVVAVVNKEGTPLLIESMDGAFLISFNLARKKAYTSAALKMATEELGKLTKKNGDLEGLEDMVDEDIVTLGGGSPIYYNNQIVGGIGVSGGSATQDIYLAKCAAMMKEV